MGELSIYPIAPNIFWSYRTANSSAAWIQNHKRTISMNRGISPKNVWSNQLYSGGLMVGFKEKEVSNTVWADYENGEEIFRFSFFKDSTFGIDTTFYRNCVLLHDRICAYDINTIIFIFLDIFALLFYLTHAFPCFYLQ